MRTRVKICGITRGEDAQHAVEAGADAIGLVFYDKSPRFVSNEQASEISRMIPAFVSRVALFKDADQAFVKSVLAQVEIDLLQFHGSETAAYCDQFERPYIKAIGMRGLEHDADFLISSAETFRSAKALLLDGHAPGEAGGSGESFDWAAVSKIDKPVVLAGGLTVENVRQAIDLVHPYAVDVSSGVERSPGTKDKDKIAAFMEQVNA
ncbi:MAG: phosphoribosylanthranilate isomerase [Gammaproteobacteria bacterium]|nr:phosphoribosylanthranilate isomerase [Gammaproteobacteria bacterium]NNJ48931.1 phosphoribosylanthranilate isomerase [Gammaproteobacteria bacterium]